MREIIKEILAGAFQRKMTPLIFRKTGIALEVEKIQAIIGPRRIGKTYSMFLAMEELKNKKNIPSNRILYFNFEDDRVQFQPQQLDIILQAWSELYPATGLEDVWFFFDEVQAAPGWERFLNRINETFSKRICFTGSNSRVLHTEIKSVMRGRSIAIELLPLSFKEYCEFAGIKPVAYGAGKSKTVAAFYRYVVEGGYPETVNLEQQTIRTSFLQEYYNTMLLRDIVEYNGLSNYSYLRSLYRMAANSIGKSISLRRLHNQLKSMHYTVGINSIYEVMDMAEDAYLFKRISKFDYSESKREKSDKRIYWLDNGLLNAITGYFTGNKGLLLENAVFMQLYRKYATLYDINIYYYTDPVAECDFIIYREGSTPLPVQVCWSLNDPSTRERELKGLLKACAYCKVKEGLIITAEEEEDIKEGGVKIQVKAGWRWMLD